MGQSDLKAEVHGLLQKDKQSGIYFTRTICLGNSKVQDLIISFIQHTLVEAQPYSGNEDTGVN